MLAVFKGIGHIVSRILNLSYETSVIAVFVLVVAYTSWGMIRAILHTDTVQGGIMVLGVFALFAACAMRADWSAVVVSPDLDAVGVPLAGKLLSWDSLMSPLLIVGLSLSTGIKMMVAPRLVVRFLLFRHAVPRQIQLAKWLTVGLMGLTVPMLFSLGILGARHHSPRRVAILLSKYGSGCSLPGASTFRQFLGSGLAGKFLVRGVVVDRFGAACGRFGVGGRRLGPMAADDVGSGDR